MEIICIVAMGLVTLAALAVLALKHPKSDPQLVKAMIATVISSFQRGYEHAVQVKGKQIDIARLEDPPPYPMSVTHDTEDEGRVPGEGSIDDVEAGGSG